MCKVIPFPRPRNTVAPGSASCHWVAIIDLGPKRYALEWGGSVTPLPSLAEKSRSTINAKGSKLPKIRVQPEELRVETRFLNLRHAAQLGERIDGWRVCWLGGWDKGKIFYKVMVDRLIRAGRPHAT